MEEQSKLELTLTNPVRRSRFRCKFLISPNSPKAFCRSSSCASSCIPVARIIHPSMAAKLKQECYYYPFSEKWKKKFSIQDKSPSMTEQIHHKAILKIIKIFLIHCMLSLNIKKETKYWTKYNLKVVLVRNLYTIAKSLAAAITRFCAEESAARSLLNYVNQTVQEKIDAPKRKKEKKNPSTWQL